MVCPTPLALVAVASHGLHGLLAIQWTASCDGLLLNDATGRVTMMTVSARDGSPRSRQPHQLDMEVRPCWSVQAPEPQDLLAAGVAAMGTQRAAAFVGTVPPVCGGLRRLVYETVECDWIGTWAGPEESLQQGVRGARREALKHPCSIQGLEWCPGVLQRDSLNPADAGLEPHTLSTTADGGSSSSATTVIEGTHQGQANAP